MASWSSLSLIYSCSQQAKINPVKLCMAEPRLVFWVFLIYFAAFTTDVPQVARFNLLVMCTKHMKPTCAYQISAFTAFACEGGIIQRCLCFLLGRMSELLFFLLSSWLSCFESEYFSNAHSSCCRLPDVSWGWKFKLMWHLYGIAGYFCMELTALIESGFPAF